MAVVWVVGQFEKVTPATAAAGVTDRLWEVADIVAVLEAGKPPSEAAYFGLQEISRRQRFA